uniref:Secreted protein n=1 Tax=Anopheles darlingi TaxID=43151 RepID=A0A2M4D2L1_ANODA
MVVMIMFDVVVVVVLVGAAASEVAWQRCIVVDFPLCCCFVPQRANNIHKLRASCVPVSPILLLLLHHYFFLF